MKGKWKGFYTQSSARLPEKIRTQETKFEVEITAFDGQKFSGTVQDDLATGGTRGIGKISGTIQNGTVNFVKEMPVQSVYTKEGSIIEEDRPHRKIYYSGKIKNNEIEGIWKFKLGLGTFNNRLVIFPKSKGTWKMKRTE